MTSKTFEQITRLLTTYQALSEFLELMNDPDWYALIEAAMRLQARNELRISLSVWEKSR